MFGQLITSIFGGTTPGIDNFLNLCADSVSHALARAGRKEQRGNGPQTTTKNQSRDKRTQFTHVSRFKGWFAGYNFMVASECNLNLAFGQQIYSQTNYMRVTKLAAQAKRQGLDWVAVVPGANMIYFTGLHMHLSERPTVAFFPADATQKPVLVLPFFEVGKAMQGHPRLDWQTFSYVDGQDYQEAFDAAAQAVGLDGAKIGVEPRAMRFLELDHIARSAPTAKISSAHEAIAALRITKDAAEIEATRKAIQLSENVLARTLEEVHTGMSEREVAAALSINALKLGSEGVAFEPLVQVGLGAAYPHGGAGDRIISQGDVLLIDFGYTKADYPADITRTVFVGEPTPELRKIYAVVQAANAAGRAASKPGVLCQEVDRATRKVIDDAGYGKYFTHRTGHGLGLEGHEPPYIVEGDTTVLEPGMLFTIEPGIYIEGVGGVRIEDNMVITETGAESLTTFTRDLSTI